MKKKRVCKGRRASKKDKTSKIKKIKKYLASKKKKRK